MSDYPEQKQPGADTWLRGGTWGRPFLRVGSNDMLPPGVSDNEILTVYDPYVNPCCWICSEQTLWRNTGIMSNPWTVGRVIFLCYPTLFRYRNGGCDIDYRFVALRRSNYNGGQSVTSGIGINDFLLQNGHPPIKMMLQYEGDADVYLKNYDDDFLTPPPDGGRPQLFARCRIIAWHNGVVYRGDAFYIRYSARRWGYPRWDHTGREAYFEKYKSGICPAEKTANAILLTGGGGTEMILSSRTEKNPFTGHGDNYNTSGTPDLVNRYPIPWIPGEPFDPYDPANPHPDFVEPYDPNHPLFPYIPDGPPPLAKDIVTASSHNPPYYPHLAFAPTEAFLPENDLQNPVGDCWMSEPDTYNAQGYGNEWIQIDLGPAPPLINGILIRNRFDDYLSPPGEHNGPVAFTVLGSINGIDFITLHSVTNRDPEEQESIHNFENDTPYRYIRIVITQVAGPSVAAVGYIKPLYIA